MRRRKSDADLARLLYPPAKRGGTAAKPPASMTSEQQAAVDRLNQAMTIDHRDVWSGSKAATLLVTTLTIHLGELLMPVGPQFVELVNQGISATPRELAQRAMN